MGRDCSSSQTNKKQIRDGSVFVCISSLHFGDFSELFVVRH